MESFFFPFFKMKIVSAYVAAKFCLFVFSGVSVNSVASRNVRQKWVKYFCCPQLPVVTAAIAAFMVRAQN